MDGSIQQTPTDLHDSVIASIVDSLRSAGIDIFQIHWVRTYVRTPYARKVFTKWVDVLCVWLCYRCSEIKGLSLGYELCSAIRFAAVHLVTSYASETFRKHSPVRGAFPAWPNWMHVAVTISTCLSKRQQTSTMLASLWCDMCTYLTMRLTEANGQSFHWGATKRHASSASCYIKEIGQQ